MTRPAIGRVLLILPLLGVAIGDLFALSRSTPSSSDELGLSLLLITLPVALVGLAALVSERRSVVVLCVVAVVVVGVLVQASVLLSSDPGRSAMYLLSVVVYWVSALAAVLASNLLAIR